MFKSISREQGDVGLVPTHMGTASWKLGVSGPHGMRLPPLAVSAFCLLGVPAVLMAELELVEGLLQADLEKSWSSWLLTLLSSDPRNCCKPAAVRVSGNGRVNRY